MALSIGFFLEHTHNYHMTNHVIMKRQAKVYKYSANNKKISCSILAE